MTVVFRALVVSINLIAIRKVAARFSAFKIRWLPLNKNHTPLILYLCKLFVSNI